MNDKQRRRFDRLTRSRDFVAAHSADFPADSVGGKALAGISNRIEEIENLDAARSTSARTVQHGTSTRAMRAKRCANKWEPSARRRRPSRSTSLN